MVVAPKLFLVRNVSPFWRKYLLLHRPTLITRVYTRRNKKKNPPQHLLRRNDKLKVRSRRKFSRFAYRKAWDVVFPSLQEHSAQRLLAILGLDGFASQPLPALDRHLCDEFLASFDPATSSAMVGGKRVTIDAASVAAATKLPLGDADRESSEISRPDSSSRAAVAKQNAALRAMLLRPGQRGTCRGFSIHDVVLFGGDAEIWRGICEMLMVKLECRRECFHLVPGELLLALDRSSRSGVKMQWAKLLSDMISRAAARKATFPFGEWLTGIIKNKLLEEEEEENGVEVDRGDHVQVLPGLESIVDAQSRSDEQSRDAAVQTDEDCRSCSDCCAKRKENAFLANRLKQANEMVIALKDAYLELKKAHKICPSGDVEMKNRSSPPLPLGPPPPPPPPPPSHAV